MNLFDRFMTPETRETVVSEINKSTVIDNVKILQNIKDDKKDDILDILYDLVIDEIKEIVGDIVIESKLQSLVLKMLNFKYSRQGTETLASYNYSGVSETFLEGYPEDIRQSLERLKPKTAKKARFI
jgi:hypothetical protein|nr:MAG: protein of unknown function DUF3199 [Bacteriophage sp.]